MLKILGYPDRYSVAPGEPISFQISLEEGNEYDARIVRVVNGDCNPAGPGLDLPHIQAEVDGRYAGTARRVDAGSYFVAADFPALATYRAFSFRALVWPTLLARPSQVLAAQWDATKQCGFKLMLADARLVLMLGDGSGRTAQEELPVRMLQRKWYTVTASIDLANRS